jgi:cytochrome b pre-mRNA-processing protein 3
MLASLFRRLTAQPERGAALFDSVTVQARLPHWYVEGTVADTIDGRFAVLATLTALTMVRLEQAGDEGNAVSVALTERFIEVMESEHREIGLSDPNLGRTVRKLVGSLARRVELWRTAVEDLDKWEDATRSSLYKEGVSSDALMHSAAALKQIWEMLGRADVQSLANGSLE